MDALLASPSRVEQGGVRSLSERGDLCYDVPALTAALQQRCVPHVQPGCWFCTVLSNIFSRPPTTGFTYDLRCIASA